MPYKKKIYPLRNTCPCGKKIVNHHWLCDKCWGKKNSNIQRIKTRIDNIEFLIKRAKNKKPLIEKLEKLKGDLKNESCNLDY